MPINKYTARFKRCLENSASIDRLCNMTDCESGGRDHLVMRYGTDFKMVRIEDDDGDGDGGEVVPSADQRVWIVIRYCTNIITLEGIELQSLQVTAVFDSFRHRKPTS